MSERVRLLLESKRFTGRSSTPVDLRGADSEAINGYHWLAIHGRAGAWQPARSVAFEEIGPIGKPVESYRGVFFDESRWDGSDLFMPSGANVTPSVVQPVKDAMVIAKFTGVVFGRADLEERSFR